MTIHKTNSSFFKHPIQQHAQSKLSKLVMGTTAIIGILLLGACSQDSSDIQVSNTNEQVDLQLPETVDFNFHVKPILSDTCYLCHGPDIENNKAGLNLSNFATATEHMTDSGLHALVPGSPELSEMVKRLYSEDENSVMPPPESNLVLSDYDKAILAKWIEQGAQYKKHWAFISPSTPSLPVIGKDTWASNEIDYFIAKKHEELGVESQQQADKETLVRRVTFDLTGLPPSLEQIDRFVNNDSDEAFRELVDSLLDSDSYGERMATEWLDVARYADTHGYSTDFYRDMSPYRDWVINAFNQNQSFDEFIRWQVAGDLLEKPSKDQLIATAFNRIHAQNGEGGIVNEEFRVEYVKDRVQTIGTGLMGLTMHCAQCHDHKYDPISAKDYYATTAFFNNIDESGQISYDPNDMPVPTLLLPSKEEEQALAKLDKTLAELTRDMIASNSSNNAEFIEWFKQNKGSKVEPNNRLVRAYYPFDKKDSTQNIANKVNPEQSGKVLFGSELNKTDGPEVEHVSDNGRNAVKLNGDDALYFPAINDFERASQFTVAIDTNIANSSADGVLFHYNKAAVLYNFKGFDVSIEDDHWKVRLAHTYPYNAIVLKSREPVTREVWQNVAMTYDGSSKASGLSFYINGEALDMETVNDNLYKEIKHNDKGVLKEIGLKVGARWRSSGLADTLVDNLMVYKRDLNAIEIAAAVRGDAIVPNEPEQALAFYNKAFNQSYAKQQEKITKLRREQNSLAEQIQEIMVMDERDEPRQAYVLIRGSYASHGEPVGPGVPERIYPFDESWPKNRVGLANWLTASDHPLVPRVIVNRYWQMLFGRGLVNTPEDFGNQGSLPSHPELLDYLARYFVDNGWDVKDLIRLMVSSSTYQQSSMASDLLLEIDPENVWLARGPSARLSAEMIRDNALASSGLLVNKIGGKSVRPYQPEGIWKMNNKDYVRGDGEELYRRSMYTIYKRSAPPPNMMAFDAPSRAHSVGVRQETSTPLQALALLNDPQIIEAARVLAQNTLLNTSELDQQVTNIYRILTSRYPNQEELEIIKQMYTDIKTNFSADPNKANSFLSVGEAPVDDSLDMMQLAALSSVTNLLINHDASVIKR
jgi:hypothetical protein